MAIYCRKNFEKSSFDLELKGLMPVLIVESDWRATNPPPTPSIFPNTSNQNFKTVILFNVIDRSGNYIVEDDNPPTALRANVVSYALGAYRKGDRINFRGISLD